MEDGRAPPCHRRLKRWCIPPLRSRTSNGRRCLSPWREGSAAVISRPGNRSASRRAKACPAAPGVEASTPEAVISICPAEAMLSRTDTMFRNLGLLKHEVGMGHLKGHEKEMVELESITSQLQSTIFNLINQIQYQDIARQKLERVLAHLRGLQVVIGQNLRDVKVPPSWLLLRNWAE